MANMQFPEFPDNVSMPSSNSKCPEHSGDEDKKSDEDEKSDEDDASSID